MEYKETDYLPLAAWLYSQGVKLLEVRPKDIDGKWIVFSFSSTPDELLTAFQNHSATGNVHSYYEALKYLRNRIAEVRGEFNRD